jgi:hypothetical protein
MPATRDLASSEWSMHRPVGGPVNVLARAWRRALVAFLIPSVVVTAGGCGGDGRGSPGESRPFMVRVPIAAALGPIMPDQRDTPEVLSSAPRYLPIRAWVHLPGGPPLSAYSARLSRSFGNRMETCAELRLDDPLAHGSTYVNPGDASGGTIVVSPEHANRGCVDEELYWRPGRYLLDIVTVTSGGSVGVCQGEFAVTD